MRYQVLVQSQADNLYVASVIGIPDCVAEGQTREEAIAKARTALAARLAQGEVVTIEVGPADMAQARNPWLDNFGRFQHDPTFDDFLAEMEANRTNSTGEEAPE